MTKPKTEKPLKRWATCQKRTSYIFGVVYGETKAEAMRQLRADRVHNRRHSLPQDTVGNIMKELAQELPP